MQVTLMRTALMRPELMRAALMRPEFVRAALMCASQVHQHLREHCGVARSTHAGRHAVIDALTGGKAQRGPVAKLAPACAATLRRLVRQAAIAAALCCAGLPAHAMDREAYAIACAIAFVQRDRHVGDQRPLRATRFTPEYRAWISYFRNWKP